MQRLAEVSRKARLEAARTQLDIATVAGVSHVAISRFERAEGWPDEIEAIIEAYASECGLEARELWLRALD